MFQKVQYTQNHIQTQIQVQIMSQTQTQTQTHNIQCMTTCCQRKYCTYFNLYFDVLERN